MCCDHFTESAPLQPPSALATLTSPGRLRPFSRSMKCTFLVLGLGMLVGLVAPLPAKGQQPGARREAPVAIDAAAWVVADSTTGVVLGASNSNRKLPIGCMTKVATALVVLDWAAAKSADKPARATKRAAVAKTRSARSVKAAARKRA